MPKKFQEKICNYCGEKFMPVYQQIRRQICCFKIECKKAHKQFLNNKSEAKELRLENTKLWKSQEENKECMRKSQHEYYIKNKEKYWKKN